MHEKFSVRPTEYILCSTNRVLNSFVSMYIKGKTFCQQLSLFNIELNMPMYVIRQLVIERFNNAVTSNNSFMLLFFLLALYSHFAAYVFLSCDE
jgi:hypothetical protein